jgi:hypothetical protein
MWGCPPSAIAVDQSDIVAELNQSHGQMGHLSLGATGLSRISAKHMERLVTWGKKTPPHV